MLSLSVYKSYTPAESRGEMVEFIEGWMDKGLGPSKSTKLDPLGNSMVESSRQLSGLKLKTKPPKKTKKPEERKREVRLKSWKDEDEEGKLVAAGKAQLRQSGFSLYVQIYVL